ncbi:MAG: AraC family transcriptional regulator [Polyangiaceae bacterium]|nr:AraC family transcriptional regulator [Polyangiaceae bacterium]
MAQRSRDAHITVRVIAPVVRTLRKAGIDPGPVLRSASLRVEQLGDYDRRISMGRASAVWDLAASLARDDAFGIHAAEGLRVRDFDVLDYALRSAPTFGGASRILERYQRLVHTGASMSIEIRGDQLHFLLRPGNAGEVSSTLVDFFVAAWTRVTRQLFEEPVTWNQVRLQRPAPTDPSEHRRFFGGPVSFGQTQDEVSTDASWAERPVVARGSHFSPADPSERSAAGSPPNDPSLTDPSGANQAVASPTGDTQVVSSPAASRQNSWGVSSDDNQTKQNRGDDVMTGRGTEQWFAEEVRSTISKELSGGNPCAGNIAGRVGVSERTLRRRLQAAGTSYQTLLDERRYDAALRYLRDDGCSLLEVGFLLGFSDSSGFARACKRWTGKTPVELRRQTRAKQRETTASVDLPSSPGM